VVFSLIWCDHVVIDAMRSLHVIALNINARATCCDSNKFGNQPF